MSYSHLTQDDRIRLSALKRAGLKQCEIARQLKKDPATISRELERNGKDANYHAGESKQLAKERRMAAKQGFKKIQNDPELEKYIVKKLKKYWSPEQISGRLKLKNNDKPVISHETIYQYIYNDKPALKKYLRCKKGKYKRRYGTKIRERQREALKKKRIDLRPPEIEQRKEIGHWEGDTIKGKDNSGSILTHVERKSGYLKADKLVRALAEIVAEMTERRFKRIPRDKKKTTTYDNGTEFSEHEYIEKQTKMDIYFAHPYHSWERGTNENTNGLLRQFFPKKSSFTNISQKDITRAVILINNRPRKRLGYLTPHEVFWGKIALQD